MRAPGRERHTRGWRATPHSAREQVRHALLVNFQHGHLDRLVLRQQLTAGDDALEEARSHARDQALAMILRRVDRCRELLSAPRMDPPIGRARTPGAPPSLERARAPPQLNRARVTHLALSPDLIFGREHGMRLA